MNDLTHDDSSDLGEEDRAHWDCLPDDPINHEHTLVVGCLLPATCLAGDTIHYTCECYTAEMADAYDEAMQHANDAMTPRESSHDAPDTSPLSHSPF